MQRWLVKQLSFWKLAIQKIYRGIWLEELLKILGTKKKKKKNSEQNSLYSLSDLLNIANEHTTEVCDCLTELATQWELDNPDLEQIQSKLDIGEETVEVHIKLEPNVIPIQSGDNESVNSNQFVYIWTDENVDNDALIADSH